MRSYPPDSSRKPYPEEKWNLPEDGFPTQYHYRIEYEDIELHRHIWCEHYNRCLDHAANSYWQNFTCQKCQLFVQKLNTVLDERKKRRIRYERIRKEAGLKPLKVRSRRLHRMWIGWEEGE